MIEWSQVLAVLALVALFGVGWWWAIVKRGTWTASPHWTNTASHLIIPPPAPAPALQPLHQTHNAQQPLRVIGTKKAKKLERKAQNREFAAHQQALRARNQQAADLAWELDQECRDRDRQLQLPQLTILKNEIQASKEKQEALKQMQRLQLDEDEERMRRMIGKKALCLMQLQQCRQPVLERLEREYAVISDAERVLLVHNCQLERLCERWLEKHDKCRLDQFVSLCVQLSESELKEQIELDELNE